MLVERLIARVDSATAIGRGALYGYQLRFNKRGRDGTAKCNVITSEADAVFGVVFQVEPNQRLLLDDIERGYHRRMLPIQVGGETVEAFTYTASPKMVAEGLSAFTWYRDYVLLGARQHGLPRDYIAEFIQSIPAIPDPQTDRAAVEQAILARAGWL